MKAGDIAEPPILPLADHERHAVLEAYYHGGNFARQFAAAILAGDPHNQRILVDTAKREMPHSWARWDALARIRIAATETEHEDQL